MTPKMLRPSAFPPEVLQMFKNILVICVGNICRSPMLEYLIRNDPLARQSGTMVSSAGLSALINEPADSMVQALMLERGIDISAHRGRQLTSEHLLTSDLVLVMESWQQREIERLNPIMRGRVLTVGFWQDIEIPDPYQKSRKDYEKTLALIESSLSGWKDKIW